MQRDSLVDCSGLSKGDGEQSDTMPAVQHVIYNLQSTSDPKPLNKFRQLHIPQASRTSWRESPAAQHSLD